MMVKICGITTQEDAAAAAAAGADAIGFNFYPGSPRYITPEEAAEIQTPGLRVGVFVDVSPAEVAGIAKRARIDIVQLHGSEDPAGYAGLHVWKAYRSLTVAAQNRAEIGAVEAILLDGPAPGAGIACDWSLAAKFPGRIILAGGLGPDNVAEAIRQVRPWGVDACSRLEKAPGIKDHDKMRQFILAAHTVHI